jgi:hypothetical protein
MVIITGMLKFASMRYVTPRLLALFFLLGIQARLCAQDRGQKTTDSDTIVVLQASPDTIPLRQMDGTILHIIGYGNIFMNYTETVDGYTIVLNNVGLYEYAKLAKNGDLVPGGIVAHDPQDRTKKERRKLRKFPQHLRYQGEMLEKLKKREQNFNEDINRQ